MLLNVLLARIAICFCVLVSVAWFTFWHYAFCAYLFRTKQLIPLPKLETFKVYPYDCPGWTRLSNLLNASSQRVVLLSRIVSKLFCKIVYTM